MGNQNSRVHHLPGAGQRSKETPVPRGKECFLGRENKNRNPLRDYECVCVLGVGSAGEVSKVRRRPTSLADSDRRRRRHAATAQKHNNSMTDTLVGGVFQTCARNRPLARRNVVITTADFSSGSFSSDESTTTSQTAESSSQWTTSFRWRDTDRTSSLSGELSFAKQSGQEHEVFYALKSTTHFKGGGPKSVSANEYFTRELRNEISILQRLDHPNIVRPIEIFAHGSRLFLATELCTGGDLHSRDPYTEMEAVGIVHSVLSALAYMHGKHVAHRDIKYENIMFATNSPSSPVKLIDFGLSKDFKDNEYMKTGVGTIIMMAPQVFTGRYTPKGDVWSVGVLAYMLLSNQLAFFGKTRRHVINKIMKGKYNFEGKRWGLASTEAKAFVSTLLQVNESERPSARDALNHSWTKKYGKWITSISEAELRSMLKIGQSLESFSRCAMLKQLAMLIIARRSTGDEIGRLNEVFQCFDPDAFGVITEDNVHDCLSKLGYSSERVHQIFQGVDFLGHGSISFSEFLAATIETNGAISENRLAEAFDVLDYGRDGTISSADLCGALSKYVPQGGTDRVTKLAMKGNQTICYDDYLKLWGLTSSTSA